MNIRVFKDNLSAAVDQYIDTVVDPDGAEMRELVRQVDKAESEYNRPFARFSRWAMHLSKRDASS